MDKWQNRGVSRSCFVAGFVLGSFLCAPARLWSRIPIPPSSIDLTQFISTAPVIFRGSVLEISSRPQELAVARFQVDRWYRNVSGASAGLQFQPYYAALAVNGHGCVDFRPGTHWLVFATGQNGHLELVDDCEGAVAISPLLGSTLEHGGLIAQTEADFTAGLADVDQAARIVSIQRLGGLRSASSGPALHQVIERGTATEKKWAVYAALRTGDISILPDVRDLLMHYGDFDLRSWCVGFELRRLKDPTAVPGLIEIANTAPQADVRECALSALGENIRAIESLPTMASHLTDPDSIVRFYALNGMRTLTGEPACTLPTEPRWTEDMVDPQIQECRAWWEQTGSLRFRR